MRRKVLFRKLLRLHNLSAATAHQGDNLLHLLVLRCKHPLRLLATLLIRSLIPATLSEVSPRLRHQVLLLLPIASFPVSIR